ncbi:MAG TPA: N-acetylmuramoyl-L-alanine amidase [Steroidobacteraceae bacterium]|nr:N-acetylmuramoyl-L-alanine amidase [Steroidobacteraceae bacterium]
MIERAFLIPALLLVGQVALAAGSSEVRSVSLSTGSDATEVALDLSYTTSYRLFTLEHPHRVVLDVHNAHRARGLQLPHGAGAVSDLHSGMQPHGVWRLVLRVDDSAPASARWVPGPSAHVPHLVLRISAPQTVLTLQPTAAKHPADPPRALSRSIAPVSAPAVVAAAHAPADSDRDVVIAVDAGHGGLDPGAIGRGGTQEKDVALAIARALAFRINVEPGMRAVLTRNRDEFLTLLERIHRAQLAKADLFVSVHADSIRNSAVSGSSVYVLSERGATSEAAKLLAERQNAADLLGGVSLADKDSTLASVLLDLSQSANISASMSAAARVLDALERVGEVRKPQVQQAAFVVLKSPAIPSILVETAYISNPNEERRLRAQGHQSELAGAIFAGVRGYFEQSPPPGTHFARTRSASLAAMLTDAAARR